MRYSVYILHSPSSGRYYVGQTQDLETRLLYHNELAENNYSSKHRPWRLVLDLPVPSRSAAMQMEKYIKKRKSRIYVQRLIEDEQARRQLLVRFGLDAEG